MQEWIIGLGTQKINHCKQAVYSIHLASRNFAEISLAQSFHVFLSKTCETHIFDLLVRERKATISHVLSKKDQQ